MRRVVWIGGALTLATLAGCGGGAALRGSGEGGVHGMPASADVLVLRGAQLRPQEGGSVLDAMRESLPEIRIADGPPDGCPSVAIRGPDTLPGVTEPKVYVDGTATNGTCVLASLATENVALVEVYPMGFTMRPGYAPDAHGLILIFTKRAQDQLAGDAG